MNKIEQPTGLIGILREWLVSRPSGNSAHLTRREVTNLLDYIERLEAQIPLKTEPLSFHDRLAGKFVTLEECLEYIEALESMIYDCVSLTDVRRNGQSEALYKEVIAVVEEERR